jgi:cbb3-type cytochrome oxidase subunit 3
MGKVDSDFSVGFALWQLFIGIVLIAIIYILIKLAKKTFNK